MVTLVSISQCSTSQFATYGELERNTCSTSVTYRMRPSVSINPRDIVMCDDLLCHGNCCVQRSVKLMLVAILQPA